MAATTKALILNIAPELEYMSDDTFNQVISYAALQCTLSMYGGRQQMAQTFFCAHVLTVIRETSGDVSGGGSYSGSGSSGVSGALKREKTENLEKEFSNTMQYIKDATRYDTTGYGRMFMTIKKLGGGGMTVNPAAGY